MAPATAFITSWKALSLLTSKAWQRNLGALTYALLPALGLAINSGEYAAVIATITLPWLVYSIARAAGIGRSGTARSDARTWSWIGLSGVLLAIIGASSPSLGVLALVGLALVAFTKIRRFGYLFWIPLPLAAIYLPLAFYQLFVVGHPLTLLAEPTLGITTPTTTLESLADFGIWSNWSLLIIAVLAAASLLIRRWVVSLVLAGFGILTFAVLDFSKSIGFPADLLSLRTGEDRTFSSGHSLAALLGLTALALAVHFLASLNRKLVLGSLATVMSLATVSLAWAGVTSLPVVSASDGSVVPLLLQKQAELGTDLQLLTLLKTGDRYQAELSEISGVNLEDSNLAYRFSSTQTAASKSYIELSEAVGDLVSGNGAASSEVLRENLIGYILVPNSPENADLVAALESSTLLEGAGLTPYGDLWRVLGASAEENPATNRNPWSITKSIQLLAILGFILLAVPSRPKLRRAKDTAIFIDQSESELDV